MSRKLLVALTTGTVFVLLTYSALARGGGSSTCKGCGLLGWAMIIVICVVVLLVRMAWYITSESIADGDRKSLMQGLGIGLAGIGVAAAAVYAGPIAVVIGLGAIVVYLLSKLDAS
jgi:hypothetical protein